MKTKEDRDFETLFQTADLRPSRKFDRQLRAQLCLRRPRLQHTIPRVVSVASVMAVVSLLALSTLQPGAPKNSKSSVVARTLYAQIVNAQTPQDLGQHTTFWRIDRQTTPGPQVDACTGLNAGDPEQAAKNRQLITTAIYNDGKTSALVQSRNGAVDFQRYSDDGAVTATDIKNFQSSNDLPTLQDNTVLTDKSGNILPPDTKIDTKSGQYDMYIKQTMVAGQKEFTPHCAVLMIHAVVDTTTKVATTIEIYKHSIAPHNLAQRTTQKISTRRVNYEQVMPELTALGFNQQTADLAREHNDYVQETNSNGGYIFSYAKSIYGTARMQAISNDRGQTTAYRYTFSAQPNVVMVLRTVEAPPDGYPTTVNQLQSLATANKWQISSGGVNTTQFPGLDPLTTTEALVLGGGKVRTLIEWGAPSNIRSIYIEQNEGTVPVIPRPQNIPRMAPYTSPKSLIGPFVPFKVGEVAPSMH